MPALYQTLPRLALLLVLAVLGGCATSSQSSQTYSSKTRASRPHHPSGVTRPQPVMSSPEASRPGENRPELVPSTSSNPAVASLLQQAAQARASGDFARAQTLAERAQGLAPHDARNYLELSRIYQARGDRNRSRQMALRGLSVGDSDPALQEELQLLSAP